MTISSSSASPTRRWRHLHTVAALATLALLAAACGQKPGVHVAATSGGNLAVTDDGTAVTVPGTGGGTTSSGSSGGTTRGGSSGSTADGTTGGGGTGDAGPTDDEPTGTQQTRGNDRTGAGPDALTFGIHAPVTGAAPLPVESFQKSADLYWRNLIERENRKVLGRSKVNVLFKDDKYQPNTAVQACRELAAQAFLLVGGGGTDQVQACGRFADQAKVPYLSAGVTEAGLDGLPYYFATSMTYRQQGPLLAQYVKKNFGGQKVGMIVTDTPNFDDAVAGWEQGVADNGINYYKTLKHSKGDQSWYTGFGKELADNGVKIVYMLTAPVDYIQFAQQNKERGFQYVGVGVTMGLNAVLGSGCPDVANGIFFSPSPGLDWARQNLPQFFQAAKDFNAPADDIALLLWGNAADQHQMLIRYGKVFGTDLTREDFRDVLEQQQGISTGVFPPLSYSPQSHFGANQVHVLKANCTTEEYETLATFAAGF